MNRNEKGKWIFSDAQTKQLQKRNFRESSLYAVSSIALLPLCSNLHDKIQKVVSVHAKRCMTAHED